jgi:hypothetical protein
MDSYGKLAATYGADLQHACQFLIFGYILS